MCGIFGYVSEDQAQDPVSICVAGLKRLEYRGYDSAGIAGIIQGSISGCKEVGRVQELEDSIKKEHLHLDVAIAHTRWATHGKPTKVNAHPHYDLEQNIALVHNGIIENYKELKDKLQDEEISCVSETDTEVIVQLLALHNKKNPLEALRKTLKDLVGSFAIAFVHKDFPKKIFAAARETPLAIGLHPETKEVFLASDPNALEKDNLDLFYLDTDEIAILGPTEVTVYDKEGVIKDFKTEKWTLVNAALSKSGFEHYMLKEIFEQPVTIQKTLENRLSDENATAYLEELSLSNQELLAINRILILGCGTSFHAGLIAGSMIESMARIPTEVEIASEYRYANPIISENTLVIAISQSGETADTIAAVKEVKAKGAKVIAICNVKHSSLTREADSTLFLKAGPEISVCSTKAFTSQLALLSLFSLLIARLKGFSKEEGLSFIDELRKLPNIVERVLSKSSEIESLAKKYAHYPHFFFLGRRYMHGASLEAALKLKEISYVNATGYPAGEMKHGPIALIDENLPTIAMCGNEQTLSKMVSNIMEIKARGGPVLAFANVDNKEIKEIVDDIFFLPKVCDLLASVPYSIATQLFAYYVAKEKGTDIDKPRNLAKSVTVE